MGSAVLVVAILPAEFGVDPLKTGQILGLNALAAEANPFEEQLIPHRTDSVEFELALSSQWNTNTLWILTLR